MREFTLGVTDPEVLEEIQMIVQWQTVPSAAI
jgi:hypothetical protein